MEFYNHYKSNQIDLITLLNEFTKFANDLSHMFSTKNGQCTDLPSLSDALVFELLKHVDVAENEYCQKELASIPPLI